MEVEERLRMNFGYTSFKSALQRDAVLAVYQGKRDVFVSMPTGAGKSLCFQLPSLLTPGVAIVFSPLLALIEDQVKHLKSLHIPADSLNSKTLAHDRKRIMADLGGSKEPTIKLLYITPELAATKGFSSFLHSLYEKGRLSRMVVDEAHCVSEWGHDFRPDYLKLGKLREQFSSLQCVALTATATPHVQEDVTKTLQFRTSACVFRSPCFRRNLMYEVRYKELLRDPVKDLKDYACQAIASGPGSGSGIVYCRTRDGCQSLAGRLASKGLKSKAYHAGLKPEERSAVQQQWMDGQLPVIVATISFGMGVDKTNVRFVAHWTIPKSIEAYYQESGRAGRDGLPAFCCLYYSRFDRDELVYLLKKEASKKKKGMVEKGGGGGGGGGGGLEAQQQSFEKLVKYCEEPMCRHSVIAEYFRDPKPQCNKSCDYCHDPAGVKKLSRSLQLCQPVKKSNLGSQVGACFEVGRPDADLYGGGRWGGYQSVYGGRERGDDDTSCSEDDEEDYYRKQKNDFFESEFRKRRRKTLVQDEVEIPGEDCLLKDPTKSSRVPRLTLKVREHCLSLLMKSLEDNIGSRSHSSYGDSGDGNGCATSLQSSSSSLGADVEQRAVEMEHSLFCSSKTVETYKLSVHKKVSAIKSCTKTNTIWLEDTSPGKRDSSSSMPMGFVKASELASVRQDDGTVDGLASSPLPQNQRDEDTGLDIGTLPSADNSIIITGTHPSEESISIITGTPSSDDSRTLPSEDPITSATGMVLSTSKPLSRATHSRMVGSCSSSSSLSCEKKSEFVPASQLLNSTKGNPSSEEEDEFFGRGTTAKRSLPQDKTSSTYTSHAPVGKGINYYFEKSSWSKSSPSPPAHEAVVPRIPYKALQGSMSMKHEKMKAAVADVVVKRLNPYFRNKKITSKDLFKKFAKKVSNYIATDHEKDGRNTDVEKIASELLHSYFKCFGTVSSQNDISNLDRMLEQL